MRIGISIISLALTFVATTASAGVITSGTVYNNTGGVYGAGYEVENISNQSGLSAGYTDGVTDFDAYIAVTPTHATEESDGGSWLSAGVQGLPYILDFDLGSSQLVSTLALWNGAAGNNASIQSFSVFGSDVSDFSVSSLMGDFVNPIGVSGLEPVNVFDLTDLTARYLRIVNNSTYGNGCCVVIGEVAWNVGGAASEVPLPAALPLFLGGLASMSLFNRKRKRA